MPLIALIGKELGLRPLRCWNSEMFCAAGGPAKTPKVSRRDSELENLLRTAVRLLKSRKRGVGTTTVGSKGSRKAR